MSYPKINDKDFYKKINRKFKKYEISNKKKSIKQICFPKSFELQMPQHFLGKYINPESPYKGILIFHRIGSGKTCTAINIAEQWKKFRKIVVVAPASLIGNFKNELRSQCAGNAYLTDNERKKLKELEPKSVEYKKIIEESDERINKHYEIYSYNKFVELSQEGKINLNNRVLIIDEIQNMISESGVYYEVLYEAIQTAPSNLRIVLLSATPMFDKPHEVALTLNLLRLPVELPTGREFERTFIKARKSGEIYHYGVKNIDLFKDRIKGYVSYFRGAPPYTFPHGIIKYVKLEMSPFQYKSYLTVLSNENTDKRFEDLKKLKIFNDGEILDLPNNFFIGTRIISNIAFPDHNIGEKGLKSFSGKYLLEPYLQMYSPKFSRIMKKISHSKGPVFVYSNFKEYGGILTFVKVLEAYGYKNYMKDGSGKKRFAIWSGDEKHEVKELVKTVFNKSNNYDGSKIKILLGSPSIKEGVSLLRVRQVHILEPYWNQSRLEQVIGRAIRYCSHKDLPEEERYVKVYIYIATHPKENETIDEYIYKLSQNKNKIIKQFELALKESAIDCKIFKRANVYKGEEDIKCIE
jgi:superfamily II DNA or RNA helicase